jgi:hypothetical protein
MLCHAFFIKEYNKKVFIMFKRVLLVLAIMISLTACAPTILSTKFDAHASPIKDVTLAVTLGNMGLQSGASQSERYHVMDAIHDRVPAIFKKNGIETKEVLIEGLDSTTANDIYPLTLVKKSKTSHVLLLKADKFLSQNNQPWALTINAQLIDVNTKKVVWSGTPGYFLEKRYNLNAQILAGSLLNALQTDGFLHLSNDHAIDLDGVTIQNRYSVSEYGGKDH